MNNKWLLSLPTIVLLASVTSFAQETPPSSDDAQRIQPLAGSATTAVMGLPSPTRASSAKAARR